MKKKEFVNLEKLLLPKFPGFLIKGAMMFISPVEHTLRGFFFDTSGWNKSDFYVEMFFMPLCVPVKQVHFTFGHRIRREGWNADEPYLEINLTTEMQKEIPFLMRLKTPSDVAEAIKPLSDNPHCHEAFAYLLVQTGEMKAALVAIDILLKLVNGRSGWEGDIGSRAQLIKTILLENPEEAKKQLINWEDETARNLGLEMFH